MKPCPCGETDPKRFYMNKTYGKPSSRCMKCTRDMATKRYQMIVKPRTIERRRQIQGVGLYGKS